MTALSHLMAAGISLAVIGLEYWAVYYIAQILDSLGNDADKQEK